MNNKLELITKINEKTVMIEELTRELNELTKELETACDEKELQFEPMTSTESL